VIGNNLGIIVTCISIINRDFEGLLGSMIPTDSMKLMLGWDCWGICCWEAENCMFQRKFYHLDINFIINIVNLLS